MKTNQTRVTNVVTVEQTGKKWKLLKLVSGFLMAMGLLIGMLTLFVAATPTERDYSTAMFSIAAILVVGGGLLRWITRIGIWWNHR